MVCTCFVNFQTCVCRLILRDHDVCVDFSFFLFHRFSMLLVCSPHEHHWAKSISLKHNTLHKHVLIANELALKTFTMALKLDVHLKNHAKYHIYGRQVRGQTKTEPSIWGISGEVDQAFSAILTEHSSCSATVSECMEESSVHIDTKVVCFLRDQAQCNILFI